MSKLWLILVFWLGTIVQGTTAQAADVCFFIVWKAQGSAVGEQLPGYINFVDLNDYEKVSFAVMPSSRRFDSTGKVIESKSMGCIDSDVFKIGSNRIRFSFVLGNGGIAITEGYLQVEAWVELPNRSSKLLVFSRYDADPNRAYWEEKKVFDIAFSEVDPELAAEAEHVVHEIQADIGMIKQVSAAYNAESSTLENAVRSIESKSFDAITSEDFGSYLEAKEKLRVLRLKADDKRNEVKAKQAELKATVASIKERVDGDLRSQGFDVGSKDFFQVPLDLDPILDQGPSSEVNPFAIWSEKTIADLQYLYGNEQRVQFLEKVSHWTVQAQDLIDTVSLRASIQPEEFNQLTAAVKSVEKYIYGDEQSSKGVIDRELWFQDNPVPVEFRRDMADALEKTGDPGLKRMANSIKNWTSPDGKMSKNQQAVLALSYGMWNLTRFFKSLPQPKPEDFQEVDASGQAREQVYSSALKNYNGAVANYRQMMADIQGAVDTAADLRVSASPLSPLKALCELITQRRWCGDSGEKIGLVDNAFNAIEVFPLGLSTMLIGKGIQKSLLNGLEIFGEEFEAAVNVAETVVEVAGKDAAKAKVILDSAKKWDSVESLLHVVKGNYQIAADGTRKLVTGMHTKLGFDNFIELNQSAGKTFSIRNVTEFAVERIEAGGEILSQTLENGVRRVQLPRDAWANADAFSDAIAYSEAGQRLKGIKTLWPESYDVSKIGDITRRIVESNPNIRNSIIEASVDGIKINVRVDASGKVLTSYPVWKQ